MRLDPSRDAEFAGSSEWDQENLKLRLFLPNKNGIGFKGNSFSGNERNRMFMRRAGNYEEVSLISGADFREDGRGFVLFDYDQDGWLDMGVASVNHPRFRILKNKIKDDSIPGRSAQTDVAEPNHSAFVRLVGGNASTQSSNDWSARDAYGAKLLVTIGESKRAIQLSCGEGLSSQNSQWIHIGMGEAITIDRIEIQWPSGKKTTHEKIAAGSRLIISERNNSSR